MADSLRQRILAYLKAQPGVWVSGDELEKKSQSVGFKASTGSRRARELHEDALIHRKEVKGTVFYCYDDTLTVTVDATEPLPPQYRYVTEIVMRDGKPIAVERRVAA